MKLGNYVVQSGGGKTQGVVLVRSSPGTGFKKEILK